MEKFLIIIQCIGAVSFTVSATIYAIHKRADVIGALVFSLLTCFGGGFIRDLAIGNLPPSILSSKVLIWTALLSVVVCIVCYHLGFVKKIAKFADRHQHSFIIEFTDSLGLASYVVSGLEIARATGNTGFVVLTFAGCITGVGGGMLRDICSAEIPFIFRKHIYLIPTLCGATFYALTYKYIPHLASMLIAIGIIISLRVLAIIFKWNLPVPKGNNSGTKETPCKKELSKIK